MPEMPQALVSAGVNESSFSGCGSVETAAPSPGFQFSAFLLSPPAERKNLLNFLHC